MKSIALVLALIAVGFVSCNSSDKKAEKGKDKYEQTKENLGDSEKHNPQRFITIGGHDKHNLIGQTVVKGTLTNTASVSSFKDVNIEISFFSKTGTLLEKDQETVYETLAPGDSKNFKTKYFAPKGTDSVSLKVLSAKSE
jgi:hypothetical protein